MKDRIKEVRKALKMKQSEFASELHLASNYISLVESGANPVSDKFIYKIVDAFNVNEEWLRSGEGEMFKPKEREEEIADMVKKMATDDDLFRFKVSQLLYSMSAEQIAVLKKYISKLADAMDEE